MTQLCQAARAQGQRVVFTNGCFDLLHVGHLHLLQEAGRQGDVLIVGLNNDASVRKLEKGPDRPIQDEKSRALLLASLVFVDWVCLFEESTPLGLVEAIRPDVLVKGADYQPEHIVGRAQVESWGGRLHLVPLFPNTSTSAVIERVRREE